MAGSRLEKFGTVFTRVRDLIRAGVIKESERPLWYDVYAAFPPKREPVFQKPASRCRKVKEKMAEILYKEDIIRAKFYEVYGNGPKAFDLSQSNFVSTCQRFVEKYQELEKLGEVDEERLFEETGKALLVEGTILRRRGITGAQQKTFPEAEDRDPVLEMKLQDMLKEKNEQTLQQHPESTQEQVPPPQ
ncbi:28S ribosomal protein S23, mitochondrial [Latimeria chalumnae]|uniref:Small ribosomal subunit protein mS23 n=1 Tax=Latimeria chalumnae TaxID=7897 RepID=H3B5A1_LATCH|nr:PREDICTED: 28S ribosomal protein S23, mitochondrial [Latimeria chalumnae]|eukprot:XP_005987517.1 PREDICTED: 28S ribosomal protein S23, mitochondrial [Latimeria chalumnae]